ncbi:hypothetical protein ACF1BE_22775 [Streptomyces sp. NPDC014991]|uniref:hypothetical protein n=1 Tax=Streptomyces sp. NPDC014991 TaxID=3364935 RepID=UPI00370257FA
MSESVQEGAGRLRQTGETARTEASATADQARQAAGQVAETAAEQARAVAGQARQQAGTVIDELRSRAMNEAAEQARRATDTLRHWSDDVAGLADNAPGDSPARGLATQVADRGHRVADYIQEQGIDGLVTDLRQFARRRPGAFLGGALLAGVAVGRLARAAGSAKQSPQPGQHPGGAPRFDAGGGPATPTLPAGPVPDTPPMPPSPPVVPAATEPSGTPQAPPVPVDPPHPGAPARPYPEV